MKMMLLFLIFLLTGCASHTNTVKEKAAFDLNCAEKDINVKEVSNGYGAMGCNSRSTYICWRPFLFNSYCKKESETNKN